MRTQSIFARLIRYIVIGAVASSALMCAQLGVTNAKYKKTYTYPDNQFSIIRADPTGGGVGVTHGYVSETVNVDPNQANFNFLQIKQAGYYAFLVYGGDGGMGGSGTARSARGAGGRASGIATMTLNEYVGGAIAMGGWNGSTLYSSNTGGPIGGGLTYTQGGSGGGASYLMYRGTGYWFVERQFACAGGGGGGAGGAVGYTIGTTTYPGWPSGGGGNAGIQNGQGSNPGSGGFGTNAAGGGTYNSMGSGTGGGGGGYCLAHNNYGNGGGWQFGGQARNPSLGGGGGSGFPGGGGGSGGCTNSGGGNCIPNGGGGGASVVQHGGGGNGPGASLGAISAVPANLLNYMIATALPYRNSGINNGGSTDYDRGLGGAAVITWVGPVGRDPVTYMINAN